jgi:hypothetical protein
MTDTFFDTEPQSDGGKCGPAPRQKNRCSRPWIYEFWSSAFQVSLQSRNCLSAERNDSFLVSFANDVDKTGLQM